MDIILVPGLWLRGDAWRAVEQELTTAGHRVQSLTLPGQGDGASSATLQDQVDAVVAAVDNAASPVVVGHSAAASLAWLAADARPESVSGVVMIGGFPAADGQPYAEFFPCEDGQMTFPGWDPFEGPDAADLDQHRRRRFEADAVPVPEAVCTGTVRLSDRRRHDVPVTLVCPEFTPADAQEWIDAGDVPELDRVNRLRLVNIESGHWPMFTQPRELAAIISEVDTVRAGASIPGTRMRR